VTHAANTTAYNADRWNTKTNALQPVTISQQSVSDTTNLPNIQYCARYSRDAGLGGTGTLSFVQALETPLAITVAGKTVTLSFWARAGALYSASSNALGVNIYTGTGTSQNFLSTGYTGQATVLTGTATLTTTWQRFTFNASIGATATELAVAFNFTPTGTSGATDYYEITGVQLEAGSYANSYMRNGTNLQGELAACQRYFIRYTDSTSNVFLATGSAASTTTANLLTSVPVTQRVIPTMRQAGSVYLWDGVNTYGVNGLSYLSLASNSNSVYQLQATTASAVLTQYRPYLLAVTSTLSNYLSFDAEL
jgi:hypothetical protein